MDVGNIVQRFVELVNVPPTPGREISENETIIARWLVEYMEALIKEHTLPNCKDAHADLIDSDVSSDDSDDSDYEDPQEGTSGVRWSYVDAKRVVDFADAYPGYTLKSLQNRFSINRLPDYKTLIRLRKLVETKGAVSEKQTLVDDFVLDQYNKAREGNRPVHDIDMQRWGIEKAKQVQYSKFKASGSWLLRLKKKHGIVSRKITNIVTKNQVENSQAIEDSAVGFRSEVIDHSHRYQDDLIFNSDQSGYNYEFHSTRTLSDKGEKVTTLEVASQHKCTHSYTIQPTLAYDGRITGKLYLCLQEPSGKMGPQVEKTYFRAPNVEVTCSSSGKLTTSLFQRWVELVFSPNAYAHCLLLLDSWTGQQSDNCFSIFSKDRTCTQLRIPEKTTGTTQPLDVYFFRQWKSVTKRFYNYVRLHDLKINLGERDNIIKLQSLLHNQFSAPRFAPMGRYAWKKAGLSTQHPTSFENAKQILFPKYLDCCSFQSCSSLSFISCAYCSQEFCFEHFFVAYHTHFT